MNTRAAIDSPLAWIIGGALICSWLFGSLHAFQAHGIASAGIALLVPPYGLYMAAEQEFGHAGGTRTAYDLEANLVALIARCNANVEGQQKSGLGRRAYDVWCSCTMRMAVNNLPDGENGYVATHGRNSPQFAPILKHAQQSCYASAQYLGAPARRD